MDRLRGLSLLSLPLVLLRCTEMPYGFRGDVFQGPGLRALHFLIPTTPEHRIPAQGPAPWAGTGESPTFCGEDGQAEKQDAEQAGED